MLDTTCDDARTVHLVQPDVKPSGQGTRLAADGAPLLEYAAPGSLGEQGQRQYSFLMYQQKRGSSVESAPAQGEPFDAAKFQQDNDLDEPVAGVSMIVELGGDAGCGGGNAPTPPPVEEDEEEPPVDFPEVPEAAPEAPVETPIEDKEEYPACKSPPLRRSRSRTFHRTIPITTSRYGAFPHPYRVIHPLYEFALFTC